MDRKLIAGAIILLVLQVILLTTDVSSYIGGGTGDEEFRSGVSIGFVSDKRQSVKRRHHGAIVWEDSRKHDELMSYDSLLTLDNSSALLRLKDDVQIHLHENTLIVLEPPQTASQNALHIRFTRGQFLSQNDRQRLLIGSGDWKLDATPGSKLSLKSLDDQRVEVEVQSGAVHVESKANAEIKEEIQSGKRFTLTQNTSESQPTILVQTTTEKLKILNRPEERMYGHEFPMRYILRWQGDAKKIRHIGSDRKPTYRDLSLGAGAESGTRARQYEFHLLPGTNHFSLQNGQEVSKEVTLHVLRAPKIRYTSPLPRDRFDNSTSVFFSWLPLEGAMTYELELINSNTERDLVTSEIARVHYAPKFLNEIYWRVVGIDEEGYRIPPHYSQPLYILENPLAAPRLQAPRALDPENLGPSQDSPDEMRVPAGESEGASPSSESTSPPPEIDHDNQSPSHENSKDDQSALPHSKTQMSARCWICRSGPLKFWLLMLSARSSYAAESSLQPEPPFHQVIFSWFPVNGADYYTIEISSEPDFTNPEVIQKTSHDSFIWTGFKKKIYYWRVAAGSNSGRMGLFSEKATVDLTKIDVHAGGEIAPGVSYKKNVIFRKRAPKAAPSGVSKVAPAAVSKEVLSTEVKNSAIRVNTPSDSSANALVALNTKGNSKNLWSYSAQLNLHHSQYSFDQQFSASLTGFSNLSASLSAKIIKPDRVSYSALLNYKNLNWKAESSSTWPYQSDLRTHEVSGMVFRHNPESDFYFGMWARTLTTLKRVDLEALDNTTSYLAGPAIGYGTSVAEKMRFASSSGILYGNEIFSISSSNQVDYDFLFRAKPLYVGGDLDFQIFFGPDSLSGFYLNSGFHIGIHW